MLLRPIRTYLDRQPIPPISTGSLCPPILPGCQ